MTTGPLISAAHLRRLLHGDELSRRPAVLDVRWDVATGPRRDEYAEGHVPGAVFVDLEVSLAGPAGLNGRHPLPDADDFQASMRAAGVSSDRPVVVYDAATAMAAARAWWLLRYFKHPDVRVLDGGLAAWARAGFAVQRGEPGPPSPGDFTARPGGMPVLDAADAAALARRGVLLDARAPERFRGESEPIDPVAGHIPGARNRPTALNVDGEGSFLEPGALYGAFGALGVGEEVEVGAYCGSGVTAAHEVLALELAGHPAALYPGSWSGWITDPARPVATGP